jgi:hypothetical protein
MGFFCDTFGLLSIAVTAGISLFFIVTYLFTLTLLLDASSFFGVVELTNFIYSSLNFLHLLFCLCHVLRVKVITVIIIGITDYTEPGRHGERFDPVLGSASV